MLYGVYMDEIIIQRKDADRFTIKYSCDHITGDLATDRANIVRVLDECVDGLMQNPMRMTVSPGCVVLEVWDWRKGAKD